jgi:histidinol-phosphate aminotransferase
MSIENSALPSVSSMASYRAGRPIANVAREFGLDPARIVKLASNENSLGMSPRASEALARCAADAFRYPDSDNHELRQALVAHLGLPGEMLLPCSGSSQIILLVARAFLDGSRSAIIPQYSFMSYELAVRSVGARPIIVPQPGCRPDLDLVLAALEPGVRVLYVATPNNPTGAMLDPAALRDFIAAVPGDILVVLDEAYRDYVAPADRPRIEPLLAKHRNLLVMRTFSKIHGLAGLRVGYAIGDPGVIDLLRRLQLPFGVSTLAQAAAPAALADVDFVERCYRNNLEQRDWLCGRFAALGLEYLPSQANFVLVRVGRGMQVFQALLRRGVIVRAVDNYGLPEWLRVTVGLPEENRRFVEELQSILSAES